MIATEAIAGNPKRGLDSLMKPDKHLGHIDQCYEYIRTKTVHPFGLNGLDLRVIGPNGRIDFVGANATDMSVNVFLSCVRFWVGHTEEAWVRKLRVISTQFPGAREKNQHHVFFEVQTEYQVIISGETTDFSGAGNAARQELEDVFALLSSTYGVEIERVTLNLVTPIQSLYEE
jgi:hypothetical protein